MLFLYNEYIIFSIMSPIEKSQNVRVAFYARVSTDEQAKEGYGIEMQMDGLNDMMEYK